jgi:hypothetical protein
MNDRSIIYTAIAGGYDRLKPPCGTASLDGRSHRMAFVDNPALCGGTNCTGWQIEPMVSICMDPRMQAKKYKVLAHEVLPTGTEYSLWVDGSIAFSVNLHPGDLASKFLRDTDLALFQHPKRRCLYAEAHTCQLKKLDDPAVMARQMNRYRVEGYPRDNGLAECSVILRRHTPKVEQLNNLWWTEIVNGSSRDQLSFNYVCWKLGIRYSLFPGRLPWNNHFFRMHPHSRPRENA